MLACDNDGIIQKNDKTAHPAIYMPSKILARLATSRSSSFLLNCNTCDIGHEHGAGSLPSRTIDSV